MSGETVVTALADSQMFPIPRLPNTCAQCAAVILDLNAETLETQGQGYRRVYFNVISEQDRGAKLFVSLCQTCAADVEWPAERIAALEEQCKAGWEAASAAAKRVGRSGWDGSKISIAYAGEPALRWDEVQ